MDRNKFNNVISNLFEDANKTRRKKNADYANDEDPFANFRSSKLVGVDTKRGIFVRLMDKIQRLSNGLEEDYDVEDEDFRDTCEDAANYIGILYAKHREEKEGEPQVENSEKYEQDHPFSQRPPY